MNNWWHWHLHDLWPHSCNHLRWQGTLLEGAEFYCLPLQGQGVCKEKGKLKLTKQVIKVLERIVDHLRQLVSMDDSQFGFVLGKGTTDKIFVVRQLQEYLAANKRLYMAFVDLENSFDGLPWKVSWWALRKLGMDEWIGAGGVCQWAEPCWWKGPVKSLKWRSVFTHSVLCPSALHRCAWNFVTRFHSGVPGRTSMPMTLLSLLNHSRNVSGDSWLGKKQWRRKDQVNAGKMKIMICGTGPDPLQS